MANFGEILSSLEIPAGNTLRRKVDDSGFEVVSTTSIGGSTWGSITGVISAQTDLNTILSHTINSDDIRLINARPPTLHSHTPNEVTGTAVVTADSRLSDDRIPTSHGNTKHSSTFIVQADAVIPNGAITEATKTKITYDAKGLVTSGADATTADIADSADKRYCTDAQKTVIGNTSGTNSGNGAANSSSMYIGTTSHALNRASAAETIAGLTLTTPNIGAATGTGLAATTAITSSGSAGGGVGYATGAGGTAVQGSSRTTTVVLNKLCGTFTMFSAAQAAQAIVTFTLTNSFIAAGDFILIQHISATNGGAWQFSVVAGAGSCTITVRNVSTGSITEATPLRISVIKGVTA